MILDMKSMMAAIVSVILVMAVVIPIIGGMGTIQTDARNDTDYYAEKSPSTVSLSITYDEDTMNLSVVHDGTSFIVPKAKNLTFLAFNSTTDSIGFRYPTSEAQKLAVYDGSHLRTSVTSITLANGTYTYLAGETEYTGTVSGDVWHVAKTGNYGIYPEFNVNPSSEIFAFLPMKVGVSNYSMFINGTAKSSTMTAAYMISGGGTTDGQSFAYIYTESNSGTIHVTGMTATIGGATADRTTDVWIYAPVIYSTSEVSDNAIINTLVGIVPVLLIVGVVVAVAASAMSRN